MIPDLPDKISNLAAMSDDPRLTPALRRRAEHLLGTMKRIQKSKLGAACPAPECSRHQTKDRDSARTAALRTCGSRANVSRRVRCQFVR